MLTYVWKGYNVKDAKGQQSDKIKLKIQQQVVWSTPLPSTLL